MRVMRPVLVVDDEEPIRSAIAELLEDEGYRVMQAGHGRAALEILEKNEDGELPLVLLDMMMPVMTGEEFLDEVRTRPKLASTHIVVVSAVGATGACQDLRVLEKPFTMRRLLEVVAESI
jgi:CheY-like chemotaxis protein